MAKVGRNDPCPCGSGKKYKKCCLLKETTGTTPASPQPAPPAPSPAPGVNIPPYTLAKMFQDSEQLAELRRRDPKKARQIWTPRQLAAMGTEEILDKLRKLSVDGSREKFLPLTRGHTDAWSIAEQWQAQITRPLPYRGEDFLGIAACELWKRYCPERPSMQMLDDWMQEGYQHLYSGRSREACELWWQVWRVIHARLEPTMTTTRLAEAVFKGTQLIFNWIQDFLFELHNAALQERRFGEFGVQLCHEVLEQFCDEDAGFLLQFRTELGEFHFALGDDAKGEEVLAAVIRDYPERAAGYVTLAYNLGYPRPHHDGPPDLERARELIQQAISRPVVDAADFDLETTLANLQSNSDPDVTR